MIIFKKALSIISFILAIFFLICTCSSFTSGIAVLTVFLLLTVGLAILGVKLWISSKKKTVNEVTMKKISIPDKSKSNNMPVSESTNVGNSLSMSTPIIKDDIVCANAPTEDTHYETPLPTEYDKNNKTDIPKVIASPPVETVSEIKKERHKIAGTSYRQADIASLGDENSVYTWTKKEIIDYGMTDQKIYQLEFSPETVELIEEPDNKYDANAVKVIVDNVLIGYIKKGSCAHIKKLIREDRIKKITAEIYGGKYKLVSSDYDVMEDKEIFELEKDKTDYFASIYLDVKEK